VLVNLAILVAAEAWSLKAHRIGAMIIVKNGRLWALVGFMRHTEKVECQPEWQPVLAAGQLRGVAEVYHMATGEPITRSRTSEVRKLDVCRDGVATTLYIKKYWAPTWKHIWRGVFRGTLLRSSKVQREYVNLKRLRALGFDAAEPVAYGEERCCGFLVRSYLVSAGIPDPVALDVYISGVLTELCSADKARVRWELIERLADYTRCLHGQGFVHYDYFWRNIILSGGKPDRFFLIDAHKGCQKSISRMHVFRAVDLAALDSAAPAFFRRSERLRFFLRYRNHLRLTREDKTLIKRILDDARPLRTRQLERIRRPVESS
jgi:tRNA A-37 threonylcarbamoyl transferase component Bud32